MDKILGFLEDHVEKMVLGIVAVICMWLLVTRVVLSPNSINYERQDYSPGNIDVFIRDQARPLEEVLNRRPTPPEPYKPRFAEYNELLTSSVKGVNFGVGPAVPQISSKNGTVVREYNLPDTGRVGDIVVGRIRAVAYTPIEEVTAEQAYDNSNSEPDDLDFITVQGRYDIAALYASFEDSFAGATVKPQWRDPCLAQPVFAAVHLQRQEKNEDAIWGQWVDMPRTRIDRQRALFSIIDDARSLPPGGLTVRMMQYRNRAVQQNLLQPAAYQIASANEEWFPPLLHREYKAILATEALEERRRQKEEQGNNTGSDTTGRRRTSSTSGRRGIGEGGRSAGSAYTGGQTRSRTSSSGRRSSRSGSTAGQSQDGGRYSNRSRTTRGRGGQEEDRFSEDAMGRNVQDRPTVEDVRLKLAELSIIQAPNLNLLEELIFWAHDDTAEPGKQYRYRVRLGVFNPVAGKNQLSRRDAARNNEVILWSAFSDASQEVQIPRRLYFFAKGIQEAAKEVTVQVSKYLLGYWYSEDFKVRGGEVIGDLVQTKAPKAAASEIGRSTYIESGSLEGIDEPQEVDYATGAMLVDVVAVNDFSGENAMRARHYFDMLYSYDGRRIERMPVGDRYWPEELRLVRSEIRNAQREPRQPLRPWAGSVRTTFRRASYSSRFDE